MCDIIVEGVFKNVFLFYYFYKEILEMKRFMFVSILGFFILFLTACGSEKESIDSTNAEEVDNTFIEASVEDGYYIIDSHDDEIASDENRELLVIEMDVKNVSEEEINFMHSQHIKLIDGDDEIDANTNVLFDLDEERETDIKADETKKMIVVFPVEIEKEYEIAFSQSVEDFEPTTIPLDTSNYADSLKALSDPAKALVAYIEEIYLGIDNADYKKLVEANKEKLQHEAEEAFYKKLDSSSIHGFPKEDSEEIYTMFRKKLAQEANVDVEVKGNMNGKATVDFTYDTLSLDNLRTLMSEFETEYHDNHEGYETEKANEYARSKIDSIIDRMETVSGEWYVQLIEKDGKWELDPSDFKSDGILSIFVEGYEYSN